MPKSLSFEISIIVEVCKAEGSISPLSLEVAVESLGILLVERGVIIPVESLVVALIEQIVEVRHSRVQFGACGESVLLIESIGEFATKFGTRHFSYEGLFAFGIDAKVSYFFMPLHPQAKVGIFDLITL